MEDEYKILSYIRDTPKGLIIAAFKYITGARSFISQVRRCDEGADIMIISMGSTRSSRADHSQLRPRLVRYNTYSWRG